MYYIECFVSSKKKGDLSSFAPDGETVVNEQFKKTEQINKMLNLKKEEKQAQIFQYCSQTYKNLTATIKTPGANQTQCINQLGMMKDFINILSLFGPLTPEWLNNCNFPS